MNDGDIDIEQAVARLRAGGVVGMPTETVYGLAADARREDAVRRVFELKGRPSTNPLIVHVATVEIAERYAIVSEAARRLFARFAPGPLTIVLPLRVLTSPSGRGGGGEIGFTAAETSAASVSARVSPPSPLTPRQEREGNQRIARTVTAGLDTVGIRIPDHPVALALLRAFDGPLATPSANVSNHISPTTAAHVRAEFGDAVSVLEGGACRVGIESTVLSLAGDVPRVLRPGAVTREQIQSIIGPVEVFSGHVAESVAAASPGQQATHYAPRAPTWRFECDQFDDAERWCVATRDARKAVGATGFLALIAREATILRLGHIGGLVAHAMSDDPSVAAHDLYATLRATDAQAPRAILIEMPPANDPAWAALRDRLTRAARPIGVDAT